MDLFEYNTQQKAHDVDQFPDEIKRELAERSKEEMISTEGVLCDKLIEPVPNFNKASCEKYVLKGENNQWIIAGRDRPSGFESGYGGRGDTKAGCIDIVVGRIFPEKGKKRTEPVNSDFSKDAARIYISQRTNIDENFDIVNTRKNGEGVGNSIGRSAIGIKADSVRIIGREGVKIVTQTEEFNSLNGKITEVKGIELIAGNNKEELQPMVKGDNLIEFLKLLQDDIAAIMGMLNSTSTKQLAMDAAISKMAAALATHTHTTFLDPTSPTLVGALPSISLQEPCLSVATVCGSNVVQTGVNDIPSQIAGQINPTMAKLDYLSPASSFYILSLFNKTN